MPVPGDRQHLANTIQNPFGGDLPRVSTYTAQEIATLQSRLDKQLGPEYISSRQGPGGNKVNYLAADKVINLANEVFGFNGWSSAIKDVTVDYVDVESGGRVSMGCSVTVRVTLKDGTYHEDIGYGEIKNCNGKGPAFEKVKKEGATDGMKRALRNFGNVLGNCLYDKSYLTKVAKVKIGPSRWSEDNLHRHPDFKELKQEPIIDTPTEVDTQLMKRTASEQSHISVATTDYDDEYGGNLFEEVDFSRPDEVLIEGTSVLENDTPDTKMSDRLSEAISAPDRQPIPRVQSMPHIRSGQPQGVDQQSFSNAGANQALARQQMQQRAGQMPNGNMNGRPMPSHNGGRMLPPQGQSDQNQPRPNGQPNQTSYTPNLPQQARATSSTPEQLAQNNQRPQSQQQNIPPQNGAPPPHDPPVGFITARAAEAVKGPTIGVPLPPNIPKFNPHAESPSIRKTSGVNHNRSGPISRDTIAAAPPINPPNFQNTGAPPVRTNFINPQADVNRRIGMPGTMQSPVANRSAYKPPGPAGLKRGPEGAGRPPLADMSNMQQQQPQQGDPEDAKRQKLAEN